MILNILLLAISLTLIIGGANFLTEGSVILARKAKVSELVIGLTIVALGTSLPELVVSVISAINGNSSIALGNVIGSNIFNSLAAIGITAIISPIILSKANTYNNIPLCLFVSSVLCLMCSGVLGFDFMPLKITRVGGIFLLLGFVLFLWYSIKSNKISEEEKSSESANLVKSISFIVLGLGALVWGGDMFLGNAVELARSLNVSEYVISVTIVAFGTSAPELATCIVAALKGRSQLAIGNIVGSNISNILLVLGASATISPLSLVQLTRVDILMLFLGALMLFVTAMSFKRHTITRIEGFFLVMIYVGYIYYLL